MKRSLLSALTLGIALTAAPAPAFAQGDPAAAQALFDEAMTLMKADKFAEACPKLEASLRLDPAMGTEYNLAGCHEKVGRIARAWAHFVNVADAARAAHQLDREKGARKRAEALEPRLPKLTVLVSPVLAKLAGLEVTRDGVAVDRAQWGLATPVDPGPHTITARAAGKKPWSQEVQAAERARLELTVPPLEDEAAAPPPLVPITPTQPPPGPAPGAPVLTVQRGVAIGVGAVGVVGLVVGAVFGAKAKSQWSDTLAACRGGDPTWCYPAAFDAHSSAATSATVSTVSFVVGGAAVAAGAITFLAARSAPRTGLRVVPLAGPKVAGGMVEAAF